MKDKRVIRVKDPKLRKIRDEFRKLWSAVDDQLRREIQDELNSMRFDENGHRILISERSPENLEHYRSLQLAQSNLRARFKGSICMCTICGTMESDSITTAIIMHGSASTVSEMSR